MWQATDRLGALDLLDEIKGLLNIAPDEGPKENSEDRPGVGSVRMRRILREEVYGLDWHCREGRPSLAGEQRSFERLDT